VAHVAARGGQAAKPKQVRRAQFDQLIATAKRNGYRPMPENRMLWLAVEYAVAGMGTSADVDWRHRIEHLSTQKLGWHGLGHCDGGPNRQRKHGDCVSRRRFRHRKDNPREGVGGA